jgi:hypothetical protein
MGLGWLIRLRLRVAALGWSRTGLRAHRGQEQQGDEGEVLSQKHGREILCHGPALGNLLVFVAELLIIIPAALVTAGKRLFDVCPRIVPLNIFEDCVHLA